MLKQCLTGLSIMDSNRRHRTDYMPLELNMVPQNLLLAATDLRRKVVG